MPRPAFLSARESNPRSPQEAFSRTTCQESLRPFGWLTMTTFSLSFSLCLSRLLLVLRASFVLVCVRDSNRAALAECVDPRRQASWTTMRRLIESRVLGEFAFLVHPRSKVFERVVRRTFAQVSRATSSRSRYSRFQIEKIQRSFYGTNLRKFWRVKN